MWIIIWGDSIRNVIGKKWIKNVEVLEDDILYCVC